MGTVHIRQLLTMHMMDSRLRNYGNLAEDEKPVSNTQLYSWRQMSFSLSLIDVLMRERPMGKLVSVYSKGSRSILARPSSMRGRGRGVSVCATWPSNGAFLMKQRIWFLIVCVR